MSWTYLVVAGLFEIGWPLGFKLSQSTPYKTLWIALSIVSMIASAGFLWLAQRNIPVGTAYAVWTGIGTVGVFLCGVLFFGDSASILRMASAALILFGIVGFRIAQP
jgi:quaternary ammonium compound-resistance protein SugE